VGSEILPKVLPKFWSKLYEFKISAKLQHSANTTFYTLFGSWVITEHLSKEQGGEVMKRKNIIVC